MVHLEPILVPIERRTGLKRSPSRHLIAEHFQSDKRFVIKTFYASAFYFFFLLFADSGKHGLSGDFTYCYKCKAKQLYNSTKIL